ncbi:MAG TPA: DUF4252 domain-containing protein [Flavobacteriaceae bacterium]|nr:DUF4252 domain-containing protein [Flavobacteriaceae bacterium]
MKKILLILAIVALPLSTYAQNSIFDKFEDMDDVTTVVFTKEAFRLAAKFQGGGEEGQKFAEMVKGIESFRVFTTERMDIANQMDNVVQKYLKSSKLTELMRVKDDDTNVYFYIREGKDADHVKELLMFVNGVSKYTKDAEGPMKAESVILSLTGDIDLDKISDLINSHVPNGGKHLKNKNKS